MASGWLPYEKNFSYYTKMTKQTKLTTIVLIPVIIAIINCTLQTISP